VSTTEELVDTGRRRRRRHSAGFKAEAVGACQQSGVSIAAVALARGLNANLLRRWVVQAERGKEPIAIQPTMPSEAIANPESFLPIALPASPTMSAIRIKIRRRGRIVSIEWPATAARECAVLLRELMR
jgi:transposase-like protein